MSMTVLDRVSKRISTVIVCGRLVHKSAVLENRERAVDGSAMCRNSQDVTIRIIVIREQARRCDYQRSVLIQRVAVVGSARRLICQVIRRELHHPEIPATETRGGFVARKTR